MASFGRHSVDVFYYFLICLFLFLLSLELCHPVVAFISLYLKICNKILGKNFKRMARENFTMLGRLFEQLLLVEKQLVS